MPIAPITVNHHSAWSLVRVLSDAACQIMIPKNFANYMQHYLLRTRQSQKRTLRIILPD